MDICYSDPKCEEIVGTFDEKKSEKENRFRTEKGIKRKGDVKWKGYDNLIL